MKYIIFGILFIILGITSILASVFNWGLFFDHWKAKPLIKILGRSGAKVFYIVIGIITIIFSIFFMISGQ